MNLQWKRLLLTAAIPVAMAVVAPAQADIISWTIIDDFNTDETYKCSDPPQPGDTCGQTPIRPGNIVWGSDAPHTNITRTIDANLVDDDGDSVATEICSNCKAAHLVANSGLPPSVGEYWFVWTGPALDLSDPGNPAILAFDWGADLAGTTWFADVNGVDSSVQAALPATTDPTGSLDHVASINLSTDSLLGGVDLDNVTQLSLHFNGVGSLDANIDNVRVRVPEPSVLALLSVGLLGLGWVRRRRAG